MIFLQVILPLFALIGTGYVLGRFRGTDPGPLSDVCLYILLPVLLFTSLVRYPLSGLATVQLLAWYTGLVLVLWGGVYLIARLAGWDQPTRSAITLSLTNLNMGSYGLPIVLFALGDQVLSGFMLLFVYTNITASSFGVYIAAGGRQRPFQALISVFRLPLIYATLLALLVNGLDLALPSRLLHMGELIGKAGPTVALVVLGIQFFSIRLRGNSARQLYGAIAAKFLLVPALGIALTFLIGARGVTRDILLISACLPTAINALLLTVRFDARPNLLGGVILGTTLLSPLTISAVLLWLGAG